MVAQITGITNYEKNGRRSFTLHLTSEFSDYEKKNSDAIGLKASTVWTNSVDCSFLFPGDIVELYFEPGFNNAATLSGIKVLSHKKDDAPADQKASDGKETATTAKAVK